MADDCTAPLFRLKLNVGDGYKREDIKKEGNQFFLSNLRYLTPPPTLPHKHTEQVLDSPFLLSIFLEILTHYKHTGKEGIKIRT